MANNKNTKKNLAHDIDLGTTQPSPSTAILKKMEKFDKNIDFELMMTFKDKLTCKKCEVLPMPDVKMMLCGSCTQLLCQKCCGIQCPLCQYKSKDPKIPTFIRHELLEVHSVFKTRPCVNSKNGCLEIFPAKLDGLKTLKVHEQNCIFQMVPCPRMDCKETVTFKNLNQHLNETHANYLMSKELKFEGTHALFARFMRCCSLNVYDKQFYSQFKVEKDVLVLKVLMHGFQKDTSPFEVSITFFDGSNKKITTIEDKVYPITEDKATIFDTSIIRIPLKRLKRYYDAETGEYKNQSKIIFTMKIINTKLDEVAKDQNVESGMYYQKSTILYLI